MAKSCLCPPLITTVLILVSDLIFVNTLNEKLEQTKVCDGASISQNNIFTRDEVNSLDILKNEDESRIKDFLQPLSDDSDTIIETFYRVMSNPLQTICTIKKIFGGTWMKIFSTHDGSKVVCMDSLMRDIKNKKCVIYSFGVGNDWEFEDALGALGCQVHAFDPSMDSPHQRTENITFDKIGLSHISGEESIIANEPGYIGNKEIMAPVLTIKDVLEKYGDSENEVTQQTFEI